MMNPHGWDPLPLLDRKVRSSLEKRMIVRMAGWPVSFFGPQQNVRWWSGCNLISPCNSLHCTHTEARCCVPTPACVSLLLTVSLFSPPRVPYRMIIYSYGSHMGGLVRPGKRRHLRSLLFGVTTILGPDLFIP